MKIKMFFTATEAKNGFGGVLDALADGPVGIEKNGRPVAVMLSAERFDALQQFELFESFRAGRMSMLIFSFGTRRAARWRTSRLDGVPCLSQPDLYKQSRC